MIRALPARLVARGTSASQPELRDRSWDLAVCPSSQGVTGRRSVWHLTGVKLTEQTKEAPPGERSFQMQIGRMVSETDFLNLYVDFCYFECINHSKCSSPTLASVYFSKRAA